MPSHRTVTLVIHPLLPMLQALQQAHLLADLTLPHLVRLLTRADQHQSTPILLTFANLMFELFGYSLRGELPTAAVAALAANLPGSQYWLHADPVELQADMTCLYLRGQQHLELEASEVKSLLTDLNLFLADNQITLFAQDTQHWLLATAVDPEINTTSMDQALGKEITDYLPKGSRQAYWHGLLTELQMLLHQHPVNIERQRQGKAPVNSLWLSGAGHLPAAQPPIWHTVYSDHSITQGLARLTQTPSLPLSQFSLTGSLGAGDYLIVIDADLAIESANPTHLIDKLHDLDNTLLQPLMAALRAQQIDRVTSHMANQPTYTITPQMLRRWWRRDKSLTGCLNLFNLTEEHNE